MEEAGASGRRRGSSLLPPRRDEKRGSVAARVGERGRRRRGNFDADTIAALSVCSSLSSSLTTFPLFQHPPIMSGLRLHVRLPSACVHVLLSCRDTAARGLLVAAPLSLSLRFSLSVCMCLSGRIHSPFCTRDRESEQAHPLAPLLSFCMRQAVTAHTCR